MRATLGTLAAASIISVASASHASAQADFSTVNVKAGDVIYVTTLAGAQISGRIARLTSTTLSIDGYDFKPELGLKIEKLGDRLWDGSVIGAVAGLALGLFSAADECGIDWSVARCSLAGAAWGGGLGLLIDWQHKGRTVVYSGARSASRLEMPSLAPGSPRLGIRVGF